MTLKELHPRKTISFCMLSTLAGRSKEPRLGHLVCLAIPPVRRVLRLDMPAWGATARQCRKSIAG